MTADSFLALDLVCWQAATPNSPLFPCTQNPNKSSLRSCLFCCRQNPMVQVWPRKPVPGLLEEPREVLSQAGPTESGTCSRSCGAWRICRHLCALAGVCRNLPTCLPTGLELQKLPSGWELHSQECVCPREPLFAPLRLTAQVVCVGGSLCSGCLL